MSPRRNRPRGAAGRLPGGPAAPGELDPARVRQGVESVQAWGDGLWRVRLIPGGAAVKMYRCPGCAQEIRPGVPHVVVWPADGRGGEDDRRHWHSACWRARHQRAPHVRRPR